MTSVDIIKFGGSCDSNKPIEIKFKYVGEIDTPNGMATAIYRLGKELEELDEGQFIQLRVAKEFLHVMEFQYINGKYSTVSSPMREGLIDDMLGYAMPLMGAWRKSNVN